MGKSNTTNYCKLFHRNMLALMSFNTTAKALKTCYKEGMFTCPNQEGFVQVSYFLMNIIYPETKAFRNCWPILDKSQERAYRAALIELIRGLNEDFGDIYPVSYVVPARLMSPGGDRFIKIMWELSVLALGVQARRESGEKECFFFQKPPATTSPKYFSQALKICQAYVRANLEDSDAKLVQLEEQLKIHQELRGQALNRMFAMDQKMREIESNAVQLFQESGIEAALLSKLLDLKNEEGIIALGERLKEKDQAVQGMLLLWEDISSLVRDTKVILETSIKQENDCNKLILDISGISECDATSGPLQNITIAKANGIDVSLLDYISGLHDRLKALKSVIEDNNLSGCLSTWKTIREEKELVESALRKLESKLEKELMDLNSSSKNDLTEGTNENDYLASSSIIMSTAATTSTPIKTATLDAGVHASVDITPYQPATSRDYFSVKLAEVLEGVQDEKVIRSPQKAPNLKSNDSSIDELLERFRKIVEIREQRSSDRV